MGRDTVSVVPELDCLRKTGTDSDDASAGRVRKRIYSISEKVFPVLSAGKKTHSVPGISAAVRGEM